MVDRGVLFVRTAHVHAISNDNWLTEVTSPKTLLM